MEQLLLKEIKQLLEENNLLKQKLSSLYDLSQKKEEKEIKENSSVNTLLLLNDRRLVCGLSNGSIIVYKKDSYEHEFEIKAHSGTVYCLTQLGDGTLISTSSDNTLKRYKLFKNSYKLLQSISFSGNVFCCEELPNSDIAVCTGNNELKIFTEDNNQFKQIASFSCPSSAYHIVNTKLNEIAVDGSGFVVFYDYMQKQQISNVSVTNAHTGYNVLCMISSDLLAVAQCSGDIAIINVNNHSIVRSIKVDNCSCINCLTKIGNVLYLGDCGGHFIQFKIEGDNLVLKSRNDNHGGTIYKIIDLLDGRFATCSSSNCIKIFNTLE